VLLTRNSGLALRIDMSGLRAVSEMDQLKQDISATCRALRQMTARGFPRRLIGIRAGGSAEIGQSRGPAIEDRSPIPILAALVKTRAAACHS
jgi:hypothetical protein